MERKVTLVGAGPGDPDLITVKGLKAIKIANVLLYDALVHPSLLAHAKPGTKVVYVGKRAGKHSHTQQEINELIVSYAFAEGHVVRLKGGDPFIFGRGKEELEYAETFGIATEAIIGVSSINLPGQYGIPLTRRGINESFWVVTATTRSGKISEDVALAARSSATVVFFMGLGKIQSIAASYQKLSKGSTPAAIISKGSLTEGQLYLGTVNTLHKIKEKHAIEAPALIVIGEAVGTHEYFYEKVKKTIGTIDKR